MASAVSIALIIGILALVFFVVMRSRREKLSSKDLVAAATAPPPSPAQSVVYADANELAPQSLGDLSSLVTNPVYNAVDGEYHGGVLLPNPDPEGPSYIEAPTSVTDDSELAWDNGSVVYAESTLPAASMKAGAAGDDVVYDDLQGIEREVSFRSLTTVDSDYSVSLAPYADHNPYAPPSDFSVGTRVSDSTDA